jgi:hypothetical protein
MALVIDASTPAVATGNVTLNLNTATFTPPDNVLLLAMWCGDSASAVDPSTPSIADSTGLSWSTDIWDHRTSGTPTLDGQAAVFHALAGASGGSMHVTATSGSGGVSTTQAYSCYVITGHDPVAPLGTVGANRQNSGSSLSDGYTASITGGQGFMVVCDWAANSTSTWAAATGCTLLAKGTLGGLISYGVVQRTAPDGVVGVTTTLGLTGLVTGGQYHWTLAEVISLEAAINAGRFGRGLYGGQLSMISL